MTLTTLYITQIPQTIRNYDMLKKIFSSYGTVKHLYLSYDKTDIPFHGYVLFNTQEEADSALASLDRQPPYNMNLKTLTHHDNKNTDNQNHPRNNPRGGANGGGRHYSQNRGGNHGGFHQNNPDNSTTSTPPNKNQANPSPGNSGQQPSIPSGPCSKCGKTCHFQCAACSVNWYCSQECQLKDWPHHHNVCLPSLKYPRGTVLTYGSQPNNNNRPLPQESGGGDTGRQNWKPHFGGGGSNKNLPKQKINLNNATKGKEKAGEKKKQQEAISIESAQFSADSKEEVEIVNPFPKFPDEFWVRRAKDCSHQNVLFIQLNNNSLQAPILEDPKPGDLCVAQYTDGKWYRASIVEAVGNSFMVFYLDYGNTEHVEGSKLRQLDHSFNQIPAQAIRCKFSKVPPGATSVVQDFLEFYKKKPLYAVDLVNKSIYWDIDIVNSGGKRFSEVLKAKLEESSSPSLMINPSILAWPEKKEVILKSCDDKNLYALFLSRSSLELDLMLKQANIEPKVDHQGYQVKQLVAFSQDQKWMRGYVVAWNQAERCGMVQPLDLAQPPCKVELGRLAPLLPQLAELPRCACPMILKGMSGAMLLEQTAKLEVSIIGEELYFRAEVCGEETVPIPTVNLYFEDNTELVATLMAALDEEEVPDCSQPRKSSLPTPKGQAENNPPQSPENQPHHSPAPIPKPQAANNLQAISSPPNNGFSAKPPPTSQQPSPHHHHLETSRTSISPPKVQPAKSYMYKECQKVQLTIGSKIKFLITEIKNYKIYGLLDSAIEDLREMEAKILQLPPHQPDGYLPKLWEVCLAPYSEDGVFNRATVIFYHLPATKKAVVLFVDYGNVETIDTSSLRPITPDLLEVPLQAFRMYFHGLRLNFNDTAVLNELQALLVNPTQCLEGVVANRTDDIYYIEMPQVQQVLQAKGLLNQ